MAKVFYMKEIAQFAVEKEQQSIDLYSGLAAKAEDEKIKELFNMLVKEEHKHKDFYADMLSHVEDEIVPGTADEEQYSAYMDQLIADSRKLAPVSDLDMSDLVTCINYAIDREKDSILFYSGLKNLVASKLHDQIDEIIREETRHAVLLMRLKEKL